MWTEYSASPILALTLHHFAFTLPCSCSVLLTFHLPSSVPLCLLCLIPFRLQQMTMSGYLPVQFCPTHVSHPCARGLLYQCAVPETFKCGPWSSSSGISITPFSGEDLRPTTFNKSPCNLQLTCTLLASSRANPDTRPHLLTLILHRATTHTSFTSDVESITPSLVALM